MTKFNDFLQGDQPKEDLESMQKLNGVYGCQVCEKYSYMAYFNEKDVEMFWYCPDNHRSSQRFGG